MQGAHCNEDLDCVEMYPKTANGIDEPCKETERRNSIDKADFETLVLQKKSEQRQPIKLKHVLIRNIVVLVILALCVAVISVTVLLFKRSSESSRHIDSVCLSSGCVTVSSRLINSANLSADPCHDFFEYSCGGWKASNFLPDSKQEWGGLVHLREKTANIIKRALDARKTNRSINSSVNKLSRFFQSCLDEKRLEVNGGQPVLKLLLSQGSWPLLNDSWSERSWMQTDAFVKNHNLFFSYYHHGRPAPIFNSCVKVDDRNSSEHIIEIDEPQFSLVPYLYTSNLTRWNELRGAYAKMMKDLITLLGGNATSLDVEEVLVFEMSLANISTPFAVFRDVMKTYKRLPLAKFISEVGNAVDWQSYLAETFKPHGIFVSLNTQITTRSMDYLKKVNKLLKSTKKRTIANYINWVIVHKFAPHLSAAFRNAEFGFRKAVTGVEKDTPQWRKCFTVVQDHMDMAVARVFVDAAFGKKKKDAAREIRKHFKSEFIRVVRSSDWMDSETKKEAEEKAKLMIADIGYPDFIKDNHKLDNYYKDLRIAQDDYFQNILNSYQLRRRNNLGLLKLPVNKRQWDIPPTDVNAYYDVSNNKMGFLAGLMNPPFFDVNGPMSVKYASFGFVVGHETTHGFDDQGRLYDKNGNLRSWWSKDSENKFRKKADCVEKQFSAYKYLNLNVSGKLTLGENIADLGGLEVAYRAFKRWEKENGQEPKLPGLNLTNDQLFFLAHGQVWCTIYNKQRGRSIIRHDPHSLPELRVNGPLSNMVEFSKAFGCSAKSKMNKKDKCTLWL